MRCARCDEPIREADAERLPVHGGSGGGGDTVVHRVLCKRPPFSPAPYPAGRR